MVFKTSTFPPPKRDPKALPRSSATWAATSIPTSSASVAAPTGNPKDVVRESNFLGSTPSCRGTEVTLWTTVVANLPLTWYPTYLEDSHGFSQHGSQAPRRVESRSVLQKNVCRICLCVLTLWFFPQIRAKEKAIDAHPDNNDDFALFQAHRHRGGHGVLGRLLSGDDLKKLHLVHWRKVVHSNHLKTQQKFRIRSTKS